MILQVFGDKSIAGRYPIGRQTRLLPLEDRATSVSAGIDPASLALKVLSWRQLLA